MLEALSSLRSEIDALAAQIRAQKQSYLSTNFDLIHRIEQLFLSWSNLRPQLQIAQIPAEVVEVVDRPLRHLVRLSGGRHRKSDYLDTLATVRTAIVRQLLLEVARLGPYSEPAHAKSGTSSALSRIPEISGLTNDFIPNALYGWTEKMRQFLAQQPFDRNVFVMVAYRARLEPLISTIEETLTDLELYGVVARDHGITDDLYNPLACLLCCRYGIAIFDRAETGQMHNANIVYELAMMQTLKRPCMILKHHSLKTMPTDFLARLYEPYRTKDEASSKLRTWWQRITKMGS